MGKDVFTCLTCLMGTQPTNGIPEQHIPRLRAIVTYLQTVVEPNDALLLALAHRLEVWVEQCPKPDDGPRLQLRSETDVLATERSFRIG